MEFCTCCKVAIDRPEIPVNCSVCRNAFKPSCVNLTYREAYKVNYSAALSWTCRDCLKISNDINILKRENMFLQTELERLTKRNFETLLRMELERLRNQRDEDQMSQCNSGLYGQQYFSIGGANPNLEYPGRNATPMRKVPSYLCERDVVTSNADDGFDRLPLQSLDRHRTDRKINKFLGESSTGRQSGSRSVKNRASQPVEIIEISDFEDESNDFRELTWQCVYCKDLNSIREPFCYRCKASHQKQHGDKRIHKKGSNIRRKAEAAQQETQDQEWDCNRCTLKNTFADKICSACGSIKSAPADFPIRSSTPKEELLHFTLLNLDDQDLIANTVRFECAICLTEIQPGQGAILKECLHQFCKQCLADSVEHSNDAEIKCPYHDGQYRCDSTLRDREIRALVKPELYEQFIARSVMEAEKQTQNSFHCKTPDCRGWCVYEDAVNFFPCPVCLKENCLTCRAIHEGMNCMQYQEKLKEDAKRDENARKTEEAIKDMIKKGEAMNCPGCKVVIMRKYGCDAVQCTVCKMELCWVTKGPRWGPRGRGDTSGGCKCGVYGRRCHPQCNYCH